ncbi:hypothetical protein TSMEX_010009 [Taenia solium]|eukprot:TsM_000561000 transcript=TsM_000561000 gene=TsM_000561000
MIEIDFIDELSIVHPDFNASPCHEEQSGQRMSLESYKHKELFKPPKCVMRAAASTLHKAANVLAATQNRLQRLQQRREHSSESTPITSTVEELTSEISRTISNTETFTSGSTYDTAFYPRSASMKLMELPKPSCRLGDVQVEWEGGDIGWRLVALDSKVCDDDCHCFNSNDMRILRESNSQLREEQELLKIKIEILLNSIAEQTALVSMNEATLERLRVKAKSVQQGQETTTVGDMTSFSQQECLSPKLPAVLQETEGRVNERRRSQSEPLVDYNEHSGSQISSTNTSTSNSGTETETSTESESDTEITTARTAVTTATATTSTARTTKTVQFAK